MGRELRRRALQACLVELEEKGIEGFSTTGACERAGLSDVEFESELGGREHALNITFELLCADLLAQAQLGARNGSGWSGQVRAGLVALLQALAARPALAKVTTHGLPALGPASHERYSELIGEFAALLRDGRHQVDDQLELPAEVELLAAGAAEALIFAEIDAGRAAELPAMGSEILFSVLVPFIGPERAAREIQAAAPVR